MLALYVGSLWWFSTLRILQGRNCNQSWQDHVIASHLDRINSEMFMVETLKDQVTRAYGFERGDSLTDSVARIYWRFRHSQKMIIQLVLDSYKDVKVVHDVVKIERVDFSIKLNSPWEWWGPKPQQGTQSNLTRYRSHSLSPFLGFKMSRLWNLVDDVILW